MVWYTSFNSYMVRLKVRELETYHFQIRKFQFLYGTIKSGGKASGVGSFALFQFLYGTIKSRCILWYESRSKNS